MKEDFTKNFKVMWACKNISLIKLCDRHTTLKLLAPTFKGCTKHDTILHNSYLVPLVSFEN